MSDSLTVTMTESIEISEAQAPECEYVGGTYANGLCTITGTMGPFWYHSMVTQPLLMIYMWKTRMSHTATCLFLLGNRFNN